MQSPGHRKNMLSPEVDHVGIAVVYARGVLYVVVDYSAAVENLSPLQVEARVAALVHASGVSILRDPTMARSACAGDHDLLRSTAASPAWMIRWQNADLSHLPQDLVKQLASASTAVPQSAVARAEWRRRVYVVSRSRAALLRQ